MKQPKKPTLSQKKLIVAVGLDPYKWSVRYDGEQYLHIVDRNLEQREVRIIDKINGKLVESPGTNQSNQG